MSIEIGQTIIANANLRINRNRCSVRVIDLANAGKRGKTCREVVLYDVDYCCEQDGGVYYAFECMLDVVETLSQIDQVAGLFSAFCGMVDGKGLYPCKVDSRDLRGVDVAPADCEPIVIEAGHLYVRAELSGFTVRDNNDQWNLPTLIDPCKGGKTASKKFYQWAKKHQAEIAKMDFSGVWNAMRDQGIASHYYCAMD